MIGNDGDGVGRVGGGGGMREQKRGLVDGEADREGRKERKGRGKAMGGFEASRAQ